MSWNPDFSDTFTRANGSLGNGWTDAGSAFHIVSNKASAQTNSYTTSVAYPPLTAYGDQRVSARMTPVSTFCGILAIRAQLGSISYRGYYLQANTLYHLDLASGSPSSGSLGTYDFGGADVSLTLTAIGSTYYAAVALASDPTRILDLVVSTDSSYATGVPALAPLGNGFGIFDDFVASSRTLDGTEPNVLFCGDSQTYSSMYPFMSVFELTKDVTFTKIGQNGAGVDTAYADYQANGASTFNASAAANVCVFRVGTNDIAAGVSVATYLANLQAKVALIKADGWKVVIATMMDRNDASAQSVGFRTKKAQVNTSLRSGYASVIGAHALMDFASDPALGDDGAADNTTIFNAAIHTTIIGNRKEADIAKPVLESLITPGSSTFFARSARSLSGGLQALGL